MSVTRDALLRGRVVYEQPAQGYRVAVEAPLLAAFAISGRTRPFRACADLGAGCGAIGLMLVVTGWAARATLVEIDPTHAALARSNVVTNACEDRVQVAEVSVARVPLVSADLVIANPPWFETDQGGVSPAPSRARARAFVEGSLEGFVRAARKCLGRDGRLVVSFPASRFAEVLEICGARGLPVKRARFVHPRPLREAQVVFAEAKPGRPGGLVIEPPLFVRESGEAYSVEAEAALNGDAFLRRG